MIYKYGDLVVYGLQADNLNYEPSYKYDLIYGYDFIPRCQGKVYKIIRYWNTNIDISIINDINKFKLYSDIFRKLNEV